MNIGMSPRVPLHDRLTQLWSGLGGNPAFCTALTITGTGSLPSVFAVSDLAATSVGVAGLALAEWRAAHTTALAQVTVDRRLASCWFHGSFAPVGWQAPSLWDEFAGDYRGRDGWIRLHTNAPHHRAAAFRVLGQQPDKAAMARAVATWEITELETAVVAAGGCAAAMRSQADWASHPVGAAIAGEPLVACSSNKITGFSGLPVEFLAERPLAGLRVLDCTRILAGPIGTRFLAGFGAEVLRLDPPGWDEGLTIPEVTLGKRCARIDLKTAEGRAIFAELLGRADVFVHGYRSDALEHLGLGDAARRRMAPHLIDVALDAYGWHTPWATRRGFDSLVQMSSGIADEGMRRFGTDVPKPLPVQALDHATGYLVAAAALRGLTLRQQQNHGSNWRLSLARTARLLTDWGVGAPEPAFSPLTDDDYAPQVEVTAWGDVKRLKPPLNIAGVPMHWDRPATPLGSDQPRWL